jgi:hypothetical protein
VAQSLATFEEVEEEVLAAEKEAGIEQLEVTIVPDSGI